MINWIKARAAERSTKTGLAVIAAMVAQFVGPEAMAAAAPWVALVAGVIQAASAEK